MRRLQRTTFGRELGTWDINYDYHFGGYAKTKPELNQFVAEFGQRHNIVLDWVYEAKMMYGLFDLIEERRLREGSDIVAVIA